MPLSLLLHLPRDAADFNASLAEAAMRPALQRLGLRLSRVPTRCIPAALRDLKSDEALCVQCVHGLSPETVRCLRWAAHKRHSKNLEQVHRQLLCDLTNGDESRVKRKPPRGSGRRR